ncbi:MAG: hypothetical protein PHD97_00325 [Bacteroidales bacterium]|nr:hypothetical protein [Bacteroidales bacterium]
MNILHPLEELKKRPLLLSVLCVLTILGNCIMILSGLFSLLALKIVYYFSIFPIQNELVSYILSGGSVFAITSIFLCFFTIAGTIKMWNLRKMGFYLYLISKAAFILTPFIFLVPGILDLNSVLKGLIPYIALTFLFVILYFLNLKYMHD